MIRHGTVAQKEQAMTDRPDLVIDGDGHVIEVDATYERIDPQYRERRPRYTQAGRGYIVRLIDGKVWGPETDIGFVGVNGNLPPPKGKAIHYRRMGTYNPWARLGDMDKDNIDVAVIYPISDGRAAADGDPRRRLRRRAGARVQRLASRLLRGVPAAAQGHRHRRAPGREGRHRRDASRGEPLEHGRHPDRLHRAREHAAERRAADGLLGG